MRSQEEMLAIILKKAKQEEHIRAALLQGSRVSKEAKPDCFQDYDVVFLVDAMEPFLSNPRWIDCFGRRIIMQIPEPPSQTRMTYLMQFADGNRIDLTLVRQDARHTDSRVCGMVLLDKDELFLTPPPKEDPFLVKNPPDGNLTAAAMSFCGLVFMWPKGCGGTRCFTPRLI